MSASRPDNEEIFHAARDIADRERRRQYVRQACGGDEKRIALIEAMLTAADSPDSLLDRPVLELAAGATQPGPAAPNDALPLEFLAPSNTPGSLGRLGHYEVKEVIGRGGMGVVLKAFDENLHRIVAVKVMAAQLATSATARQRFVREARAQAAVTHDHVVTIHAVEEANGLPYIVMQCVAGVSLQDRLDRDGPLPLTELLRIGMQAAAGLAAAHAQGLVHRDVKPANILLENGVERVKLTDFGLARAAGDASLTQSGTIAGTPHYMSPEQAEGNAIDQRTDLFSLGSVLYAMCTGRAPFRASGSMAILKRVCEEAPTPIRETNPEIPEWLVAIIDKLQAKDPAKRYQSATEVAELLGRHLAFVQQPSVAPLAPLGRGGGGEGRSHTQLRRRLALATAVLLCFVAGLSLTEATGVTNLRATVIRIFTPDGTLVVETDDPGVKVTIEGDGGLIITGAGLEEIRLRPGAYKVHADRDGKRVPLDKELVSIAKGGREVVRVKLEAPAAQALAKAEKGAFVLLGSKEVEERKFDTLAEAVQAASDGDTVEVRGNGPFVTKPINRTRPTLTIRAGVGFWPVIKPQEEGETAPLLFTDGQLTLEGLEFIRKEKGQLLAVRAPLYLANCRFIGSRDHSVIAGNSSNCIVRNCDFAYCEGDNHLVWLVPQRGRLVLENNVMGAGGTGLCIHPIDEPEHLSVRLTHNTIRIWLPLAIGMAVKGAQLHKRVHFEADSNLFDGLGCIVDVYQQKRDSIFPAGEAGDRLLRLLDWHEQRNVYATGVPFLVTGCDEDQGVRQQPFPGYKTLADWHRAWKVVGSDSFEGRIRYQAGDVTAKAQNSPEKVKANDFRLRSDSPGYRAGKDGKDLGADVDLVGPGPAYERWKKTPDYQQWLEETGRKK